ncbi:MULTISPECIES: GNAT family N-acetyltransferase [Streptomyces]|uniref:GNAT family N-acetyltransferase n=1 Tax=Streptomyces TaxID=1883 RepID=UPI00163BAC5A|nr:MULTISPECIES: GNAT family N-acetyltransferase [Streptomyces]MBC2876571.1 GNAT family N-acetyltransferase [Streptomyces sp. TYQ1024]UBI40758.1 GNAT family N-acetyltransferase [Streptomyces mobaraensis]UKW33338.1 GNAT family N-acetyltransferase [Streptomyces sp. TYQ1024]
MAERAERDGTGFVVRELSMADAATASEVHHVGRRAYAVEAELIGFAGIPALRESLEEMRAQPLRWLGAVTGEGRVAAFVAWQELGEETAVDVHRVCVDPPWFRRGLASRLLRHLLDELAPEHDAVVSTGAGNHPAVALYRRLGFVRVGGFEPVPGVPLARFRLTRRVTAG